jgi:hypothetical protein
MRCEWCKIKYQKVRGNFKSIEKLSERNGTHKIGIKFHCWIFARNFWGRDDSGCEWNLGAVYDENFDGCLAKSSRF